MFNTVAAFTGKWQSLTAVDRLVKGFSLASQAKSAAATYRQLLVIAVLKLERKVGRPDPEHNTMR